MENDKVKIISTEILSDNWYKLNKLTYSYWCKDGSWQTHNREAYDRGNGSLFNELCNQL